MKHWNKNNKFGTAKRCVIHSKDTYLQNGHKFSIAYDFVMKKKDQICNVSLNAMFLEKSFEQ